MFYKEKLAPIYAIASVLAFSFVGLSVPASAQLSNLFGSGNANQSQSSMPMIAGLPTCPPLVAGQPEPLTPDGQSWKPGVNCTLQPASVSNNATAQSADSAPLNTLDPTLVSGSSDSFGNGAFGANNQRVKQLEDSLDRLQGRMGLSYVSWPDYLGADRGDYRFALMFDLSFGSGGFLNNDDGLGWRVISLDNIEGKLSVNWHGAQVFTGATAGLNSIGNRNHLEADLVISDFGLDYELEFSRPLSGFDGWTLTASVAREIPMETGSLTARLGVTHGSRDWMQSYYGISADESLASGLSQYSPGSGLRDIFVEAEVDVPINETMGFDLRGGIRRMLGPAANSPQVANAGSAIDYNLRASFYYKF